jgi:hypothetical protein
VSEPAWAQPPVFARPLAGGSRFVLAPDTADPRQLVVSMTTQPVAIIARLCRADVQDLALALEDWLYDSRPT